MGGSDPQVTNVFLNLTVTGTVGAGFLKVYPASDSEDPVSPEHSNINWWSDDITLANLVLVALGEGSACIVEGGGPGSTHYCVDLLGYYVATA